MKKPTNKQMIVAARRLHQDDGEVEVDEGAMVSRGNDPGAYVAAWVWVDDADVTDEDRARAKEL